MRPLVGHTGGVRAAAYLPDGRLVSGGNDRTVRVWNPLTGDLVRTLKAGTPVYAVAASPDGRTIAYAGRHPGRAATYTPVVVSGLGDAIYTSIVRCPNKPAEPRNAAYFPNGIPRSVWVLAYSADGRTLAAAGRTLGGGNMSVGGGGHWFRTNHAPHGPLADATAYALAFDSAGERLAVTADATVAVYAAAADAEPVVRHPLPSQWAAAVAFVPGAPTVVVGANSALLFVDATTQRKPRKVKTGFRVISSVAASPDGAQLYVGGRPAGLEVYDPDRGARLERYDFGLGGVNAVAVAPDGLTFAAGGDDGLAVFDAAG